MQISLKPCSCGCHDGVTAAAIVAGIRRARIKVLERERERR